MCFLQKATFLEWGNEYNSWYIIPNVEVYFNSGCSITFNWLKIQYSHSWKVVTFEEEDARAKAEYNLRDNKDEPSSV